MLNIGKVIKNDLISCFRGEDPADVDRNILDVARRLDTYGITLYPCRVSCEILLAGYGYICTSIVFEVLFLVKLRLVRLRATQFLFFPVHNLFVVLQAQDNAALNLSVAHNGVLVFQNKSRVNTFSWYVHHGIYK